MKLALLSMFALISAIPAQAQTAVLPRVLVEISAGSGYTEPQDSFSRSCTIHTDGTVEVRSIQGENPVAVRTFTIGTRRLSRIANLVERSESSKLSGKARDYQGDLEALTIEAYGSNEHKFLVAEYSDGRTELKSQAGRDLISIAADTCSMKWLVTKFAIESYLF